MTSTEHPIRTAVIVGSTRPGRRSRAVADWIVAEPSPGLALTVVDIAELDLPLLAEPAPAITGQYSLETTRSWSHLAASFDAFVLVTPEYNHSTSAALKNALDHLYSEWQDKAVAFVGYGAGGGVRAVEHLRTICAELGMAGVGPQVALDLGTDFDAAGAPAPGASQCLARERMLAALTRWGGALLSARDTPPEADSGSQDRPTLDLPALRSDARGGVDSFVAGIQAGLDRADAKLYDAAFAADVLWGSPFGRTLEGIEPLAAAHRSLMSDGVGTDSRYEVVQVLAPAPGVAIAHVRRQSQAAEADSFSEMALYVLVKRDGRWWLAAGQNTPIANGGSQ